MKVKGNFTLCLNSELDSLTEQHIGDIGGNGDGSFAKVEGDIPLEPKASDYYSFPFRQLSATIVGAGSVKATDFRNQAVLRAGMSLLENRPVYLDHVMQINNEVGFVGKPVWRNKYVNSQGITIPAGIDAPMNIDSVLYPNIVRKMNGPVPYIKSSSVTVAFEWEASHEFETPYDFYYSLGSIAEDGEMVRRIVTKINEFYESSLVAVGADPYAGILDDEGQVQFIDREGVIELSATNSKIAESYNKDNKAFVSVCLGGSESLNLSKINSKPKEDKMKDELMVLMAEKLECSVEELELSKLDGLSFVKNDRLNELDSFEGKLTEAKNALDSYKVDAEKLQSDLNAKLETSSASLIELTATNENLIAEKDVLIAEKDALSVKALKVDAIISSKVDYAVEMYGKSVDGKVNEIIVNDIKATDSIELLDAKIEMYGGKAHNSYGAKCLSCGSGKITHRSSVESDNDSVSPILNASSMGESAMFENKY
jgi:hypothetical protein